MSSSTTISLLGRNPTYTISMDRKGELGRIKLNEPFSHNYDPFLMELNESIRFNEHRFARAVATS